MAELSRYQEQPAYKVHIKPRIICLGADGGKLIR